MKSPFAYIRISTKQQADYEKAGIKTQLNSLEQTLLRIDDSYKIEETEIKELEALIDAGNPSSNTDPYITKSGVRVCWDIESGTSSDRVAFNFIQDEVTSDRVSHLIGFASDRFWRPQGRDRWKFAEFMTDDMTEHSVELWVNGAKKDTEGIGADVVEVVAGHISGAEIQKMQQRSQPARNKLFVETGRQGGRTHFLHARQGYIIKELMAEDPELDKNTALDMAIAEGFTDPKKVYIHWGHVKIVEEIIVPMIEQGLTAWRIVQKLNDIGIHGYMWPSNKNSKWNDGQIFSLFGSQAYGKFIRRTRNRFVEGKDPETLNYDDESLKVFSRTFCKQMLAKLEESRGPRIRPKKHARAWLLKGILHCQTCHNPISTKSRNPDKYMKKTFYYKCRKCGKKTGYLRALALEQSFMFRVKLDILQGAKPFKEMWTKQQAEARKASSPLKQTLETLSKNKTKVEKEMQSQIMALNDVKPGGTAYLHILHVIESMEERLDNISIDIEETAARLTALPTDIDETWLKTAVKELQRLAKMSYEEKLAFLHMLIERAEYHGKVPFIIDEKGEEIFDGDNESVGRWRITYKVPVKSSVASSHETC